MVSTVPSTLPELLQGQNLRISLGCCFATDSSRGQTRAHVETEWTVRARSHRLEELRRGAAASLLLLLLLPTRRSSCCTTAAPVSFAAGRPGCTWRWRRRGCGRRLGRVQRGPPRDGETSFTLAALKTPVRFCVKCVELNEHRRTVHGRVDFHLFQSF